MSDRRRTRAKQVARKKPTARPSPKKRRSMLERIRAMPCVPAGSGPFVVRVFHRVRSGAVKPFWSEPLNESSARRLAMDYYATGHRVDIHKLLVALTVHDYPREQGGGVA